MTQPTATTADQPAGSSARPLHPLAGALASQDAQTNTLKITVGNSGYSPNLAHARPGLPFKLAMVTNKTYSCARALVIPSLRIEQVLPPTGTVLIDIPAQPAGSKLFYSCSMGMYSGVIVFDE